MENTNRLQDLAGWRACLSHYAHPLERGDQDSRQRRHRCCVDAYSLKGFFKKVANLLKMPRDTIRYLLIAGKHLLGQQRDQAALPAADSRRKLRPIEERISKAIGWTTGSIQLFTEGIQLSDPIPIKDCQKETVLIGKDLVETTSQYAQGVRQIGNRNRMVPLFTKQIRCCLDRLINVELSGPGHFAPA